MPHAFHPADIVRIARLEATQRDVDGTAHPPPQPRVGEKGRIVVEVESGVYLVERSTDDGTPCGSRSFSAWSWSSSSAETTRQI